MASLLGWLAVVLLIGAGIALWWIHRLIAWGVLYITRDAVVYLFGDDFSEDAETVAIVCWRVIVPVCLFAFCYAMVSGYFAQPRHTTHWAVSLALSLSAASLVIYHYFRLFAQKPPGHRSWPRFLAADIKLRMALKLAWIEEKFRWRL